MGEDSDNRIHFRYNFSEVWSLASRYKLQIAAIILLVLLIESTAAFDNIVLKWAVDEGTGFAGGKISDSVFSRILLVISVYFVGINLLRFVWKWFYVHSINSFETKVMRDLKIKYFSHVLGLSHRFHVNTKTGGLISKIIRGSSAVESLMDVFIFNFFPLIIKVVATFGIFLYFDLFISFVLLIIVFVFLGFSLFMQKVQEPSSIKMTKVYDVEKANISDFLTNIESIKYFGKEKYISNRFKKLTEDTRSAFLSNWKFSNWTSSTHNLIMGVGMFVIVLIPLTRVLNGTGTIGTVALVLSAVGGLTGNLYSFFWGIRRFYRAMADLEPLFRYGKEVNEVRNVRDAEKLKISTGEIFFNKVWFKYHNRWIFKDFSLKIPKNKKVALVGPSGCGKTTLIKLLFRLYDVNDGSILVDGKDIRTVRKSSLRSEMSIVPQECVLFDDTVYNNIAFSNQNASKNDVFDAMRFAQLDRIVSYFPDKENTIVGERGVKLSGGEKQRVSIARAILADKKVLVLDEATSSLDSETEHEIQQSLGMLMENRTSIIIAHRLSTIMKADIIVVMDDGRIVQKGTHEELIRHGGLYKKLWDLQKGGYIK